MVSDKRKSERERKRGSVKGLCGGGTAANWTCWVKWKLIVLNNFELGKAKGTNIFLFCQRRSWRQQQQQLALFIVSQNGRVFSFVPLYLPLSRSVRLPAAVIIDSRLCILGHFVCVNRRRCCRAVCITHVKFMCSCSCCLRNPIGKHRYRFHSKCNKHTVRKRESKRAQLIQLYTHTHCARSLCLAHSPHSLF